MLNWIKSLFTSPKTVLKIAVDSLDFLESPLAVEIEKVKTKFNAMTSPEQSKWIIDQVQAFLRDRFKLNA